MPFRNRLKAFFYFCFCLVCISCSNTQTFDQASLFTETDFLQRQSLRGEKWTTSESIDSDVDLWTPQNITIIDTFLLVVSSPYSDRMASVYGMTSHQYLGKIASMGRGPDELLLLRHIGHSDTLKQFWLFDHSTHKLLIFNDRDLTLLGAQRLIPARRLQLELMGVANRVHLLSDTIVTCYKMAPLKRISFLDTTGHYLTSVGEYPKYTGLTVTEDRLLSELFDGNWVLDETTRRIAIYSFKTDLLCIYDTRGHLIKRLHGPDHYFPEFTVRVSGRNGNKETVGGKLEYTRFSYFDIVQAGGKIWALYQPKLHSEYPTSVERTTIFTFDWNGTPIAIYDLDHPIERMAIDTIHRIIYGVNLEEESIFTFKYD